MAHTPGPWEACRQDDDRLFGIVAPKATPPVRIATVWCNDEYANARLMAAAPDMLAALKLVQEELPALPDARCNCLASPPCNDCVEYGHQRDVEAAVVNAIAKAEGRRPPSPTPQETQ